MTVAIADARAAQSRRRRRTVDPKLVMGVLVFGSFLALGLGHFLLQSTVWASESGIYNPRVGYDPAVAHPSGPGSGHLLGTDPLGRDVLSLLTYSLRPSLAMAAVVAVVAGVASLLSAASASYYRGRVDGALSHLADALLLLPPPLLFLVVGVARPEVSSVVLGVLYGLVFGLGAGAIIVRSRALVVMQKPFIDAARVSGGSARWIMTRHLFPHLLPHVAVQVLAGVTGALITQGFVEYIAGGTRIGLGNLVYLGLTYQRALFTNIPWSTLLAGGLSITLLAASFYLMSTGLSDTIGAGQERGA